MSDFNKKVTDFKVNKVYENEKGELFKVDIRGIYFKATSEDSKFEETTDITISDKFRFTSKAPKRGLKDIYSDYLTDNLASARENNKRLLLKTLVESVDQLTKDVAELKNVKGKKKKD